MLDPLEEHFRYVSDRVKIERHQGATEHFVMNLGCRSGLLIRLRHTLDTGQ
jgi:hypothetical protein